MRYYTLADRNQPLLCDDVASWAAWRDQANLRVAEDSFSGILISTVFVGTDSHHRDGTAPLLWETAVFGGPLHGAVYRYATFEAAAVGHAEVAEALRTTLRAPAKPRPNCYKCLHRTDADVSGLHSRCGNSHAAVRGNLHGVAHGWFCWPVSYDPVWLDDCDGFVAKGDDSGNR